ncbi:MAG: hypothetical protein BMS9Abin13_128 [Patescibacteria group bacterium]|nr:MAG: hypothetical protein BMS9Abin13_128 [Patescibacteria group bacterium]
MTSKLGITIDDFMQILPRICDKETTQEPHGWSPENPLWGHCAVVSIVAQNLFGGTILRASLKPYPKFSGAASHYWNLLESGEEKDFTAVQFGNDYPEGMEGEERTRSYILSHSETVERYKLLAFRLAKAVTQNPLFENDIYRLCFMKALESECRKMWFGCAITHEDNTLAVTANKSIEPLKHICEPTCVRSQMQPQGEAALGACVHAEEWALWEMTKRFFPTSECDLWIAGVNTNGMPWFKEEAVYTCLHCAPRMFLANFRTIHVPVGNRWEGMSPEEAVRTASEYALKQKSA